MSTLFFDLPFAPVGEKWCQACVMLAKGRLDKEYEARFKAALTDGKDETNFISPKLSPPLQLAKVRGPWQDMPNLGDKDLCWTHVAGVALQSGGGLAVVNGDLPPGLARGRG
jgi:hypothetical protein